jgi:hypothetical protein
MFCANRELPYRVACVKKKCADRTKRLTQRKCVKDVICNLFAVWYQAYPIKRTLYTEEHLFGCRTKLKSVPSAYARRKNDLNDVRYTQ